MHLLQAGLLQNSMETSHCQILETIDPILVNAEVAAQATGSIELQPQVLSPIPLIMQAEGS